MEDGTDRPAPPSLYADEEEVPAEILDEEDAALADRLFAEENAGMEEEGPEGEEDWPDLHDGDGEEGGEEGAAGAAGEA